MLFIVNFGNQMEIMISIQAKKISLVTLLMGQVEKLLIEYWIKYLVDLKVKQIRKCLMKILFILFCVKKIKQQQNQLNIGLKQLILIIMKLLLVLKWITFMKNQNKEWIIQIMNLFYFRTLFVRWLIFYILRMIFCLNLIIFQIESKCLWYHPCFTDWDRFAFQEYVRLAMEEENQEQGEVFEGDNIWDNENSQQL
ncbi:unnamed protein product [Paramecium sonneborni]|uniref:Transmembrane protein n=1 Tax=Paramecium sonneborni TaxID=65129 RepID=A0A8S1KHA2_9CILI|nr:unnamed protein product [Paramecium sonneborni]